MLFIFFPTFAEMVAAVLITALKITIDLTVLSRVLIMSSPNFKNPAPLTTLTASVIVRKITKTTRV